MCLSETAVTSLCFYPFGYALGYHIMLWTAPETWRSFSPDGRLVAKMTRRSVQYTLLLAGLPWVLDRVFEEAEEHRYCTPLPHVLLFVWIAGTLLATALETQKQVRRKTGIDVIGRETILVMLTGSLFGLGSSTAFHFGLI